MINKLKKKNKNQKANTFLNKMKELLFLMLINGLKSKMKMNFEQLKRIIINNVNLIFNRITSKIKMYFSICYLQLFQRFKKKQIKFRKKKKQLEKFAKNFTFFLLKKLF